MKIETSEYCTVGHPDRMCDYIASYILDRYLERDRDARVALEVQFKDCFVTVSGEVTSCIRFTNAEIAAFVREAVKKIGYTDTYRDKWGEENTISGDGLEVTVHLSQQSGDIAQGVDRASWGDQGIMFGMATRDRAHGQLPAAYDYARLVGQELMVRELGGLDIKTQVTTKDGNPVEVVVAIPLQDESAKNEVARVVRALCGEGIELTINGTGRYVKHGPIGDCGTTGRKLVVDFYGGHCRIGGGSPWGKDPTKADVALNRYARHLALDYLKTHDLECVFVQISCCIGLQRIRIAYFDESGNMIESRVEETPTDHVIELLKLKEPRYAVTCRYGLFGYERD